MRRLNLIKQAEGVVLPVEFVHGKNDVEVREFILRDHTPEWVVDYFADQDDARLEAVRDLEEHELGDDTVLRKALGHWLTLLKPTVVNLLSEPADDGPPATTEDVDRLHFQQLEAIVMAQDEMLGLGEHLGNAESLLALAGETRLALTESSLSSDSLSPEPEPALTP